MVVVAFDPLLVIWREQCVPLSPTEAEVYAHIWRRRRAAGANIDKLWVEFGSNPSTRSLVVGRIRKFHKIDACEPFEILGPRLLELRVEPDITGSTAPVTGPNGSRYATVRC